MRTWPLASEKTSMKTANFKLESSNSSAACGTCVHACVCAREHTRTWEADIHRIPPGWTPGSPLISPAGQPTEKTAGTPITSPEGRRPLTAAGAL